MSYIKSYGIAFPQFRIEDCMLHPKGKKGVMKGICFPDEDIITLAYQAVEAIPKENIDGIFFATSTPVFHDRYHASFLADLLDISPGIFALDFINSSRSGTDALLVANVLIDSGKYRNILVVASDVDFPEVGKELYTPFGHAACALLLSHENGDAEITSAKSYSSSFAEEFFYKGEKIQYDTRFSREAGFKANLTSSLNKLTARPGSFNAVILNSLYSRMAGGFFSKAGFEEAQLTKDLLSSKMGNTGSPHALLLLVSELENGKKNILLADYTNGINFFEIQNNSAGTYKSVQEHLGNYDLINSYQDYLLLRKSGNFNSSTYETKEVFSSEMMQEREKETLLYLKGLKCEKCGTIYYLKSARCKKCKSDKFLEVQLAKTGVVYAFTAEHYFPSSFPPVVMVITDIDGG
ncbi:MAG: zinc ribbon domain-containing protein, partial [Bacteroidia bacterium]